MTNHIELDSLGILSPTIIPKKFTWMSDEAKQFLLHVLLCGAEGMHKRQVGKYFKGDSDMLIQLSANSLIHWETDKFGKPAYLTLTWKGEEVAKLLKVIAKSQSTKKAFNESSNGK